MGTLYKEGMTNLYETYHLIFVSVKVSESRPKPCMIWEVWWFSLFPADRWYVSWGTFRIRGLRDQKKRELPMGRGRSDSPGVNGLVAHNFAQIRQLARAQGGADQGSRWGMTVSHSPIDMFISNCYTYIYMQNICLHHFYHTTEMAWCKSGRQPTHLGSACGAWFFRQGQLAKVCLEKQHVVALCELWSILMVNNH